MDLMWCVEWEIEENVVWWVWWGYVMDVCLVIYGVVKFGEDEWGWWAREVDEDGDASAVAVSGDSDVDDEDDEWDDDEDVVIVDEEFKVGVCVLKWGDLNEVLWRFVYVESCCFRSMTEVKEKLLKMIV